jgi:hypothetical protein
MSRTDTIDVITRHLPMADQATLDAICDVLTSAPARHTRPFTDEERARITRSKSDFAAARTLSPDELNEFLDASAAKRAAGRES